MDNIRDLVKSVVHNTTRTAKKGGGEAVFVADKHTENAAEGDYIGDCGLMHCGKCGTPKQHRLPSTPKQHPVGLSWISRIYESGIVPIMCKCVSEARQADEERQKAKEFAQRIERLRRDGLTDPAYLDWTFDIDDRQDAAISDACRKYVDEWPQMRKSNVGLLFMGDVGTGKTFYACCIANALINKQIPVLVTNFPRLIRIMQATAFDKDNMDILNRLQKYELVVIDDLGVERGTEYAVEQVYSVIDTRYRSGKPMIITTNLSPEDLKTPESLAYGRIYDRVIESCPIMVRMDGEGRRKAIGKAKRDKYRDLLGF